MQLDRAETLRYLGYGTHAPDERTDALIAECAKELEALPTVRHVERSFSDLVWSPEGVSVGGASFASRRLAETLSGCGQAVVLCATLGAAADRLRMRYIRTDLTKAAVMDAAQSAYIEQVCDAVCADLRQRYAPQGLSPTPRFSPGYGDFALSEQPMLLALANAPRRIGLTCSETFLLTPQKSVTAIIGLTRGTPTCGGERCAVCEHRELCRFRRT